MSSGITVWTWVKASSQTSRFLISKYDNTSNFRAYALWINGDQYPSFSISTDGTSVNLKNVIGPEVITDNVYHFVAGVFTPSISIKIYVDGVLKNTNTTSIPETIFDTSTPLLLGAFHSAGVVAGFLTGSLVESGIANRAFSQSEMINLYNTTRHELQLRGIL